MSRHRVGALGYTTQRNPERRRCSVPEHLGVDKTRLMVRIDPPKDGPERPGSQEPEKKTNRGRIAMWVGAGVLAGALLGVLIAWFFITGTGEAPLLPAVGGNTETSATNTVQPSSTTEEDAESAADASGKDSKRPPTPEITFPEASEYWLAPEKMKIEIKWERVSDASGVSYVLEFSHWLGGGEGWTTPTRTSKLKRLYYNRDVQGPKERFRIIAVDGAGNESDPSPYRTLVMAPSASEAASLNAGY
jgi:hypothetical protein